MMPSSHTSRTAIDRPSGARSRVLPFWVDIVLGMLLVLSVIGFTTSLFVIYLVDEYGFLAN